MKNRSANAKLRGLLAPFASAWRAHHGPKSAYFAREREICGPAIPAIVIGLAVAGVFLALAPFPAKAEKKAVSESDGDIADARKAEKTSLDSNLADMVRKILAVNNRLKSARDRAIRSDQEIAMLQKAITEKQAELERRLIQKRPDIAKMTGERDKLLKEHAAIVERLAEINKGMVHGSKSTASEVDPACGINDSQPEDLKTEKP
ncbi:MAG: hypothetical protein QME60_01470 [Verrucomicrobiota bacterium]|nr:hypothetical protein [Verrucomicrobiota bacterium]